MHLNIATRRAGLDRLHRGGKADLISMPALFADVDEPNKDTLIALSSLPPTLAIDSGRGAHYYWMLDTPTEDMARAERLLLGLSTCLSGCRMDVTHSLRLPNTYNHKYAPPKLCRIVRYGEKRYTLDEIEAAYPPPAAPPTPAGDDRRSQFPAPEHGFMDFGATVEDVVKTLCSGFNGIRQGSEIKSLCPLGHAHDRPGAHFKFSPTKAFGICHGKHGKLPLLELCSILHVTPTYR